MKLIELKKFKIISSIYKIKYVKSNLLLSNSDRCAECDYVDKEIKIVESFENKIYSEKWLEETLTHEIAHAFLYESGQQDLNDERHAELLGKFVNFIQEILK